MKIVHIDMSTGLHEINLFAHNMGQYALTKATEFIVINNIGCSPSANWAIGKLTGGVDIFVGVRISTTEYFCLANGAVSPGIRGLAAPYPESALARKTYQQKPELYILPGQRWEIPLRFGNLKFDNKNPERTIRAFVSYTLYDGPDAVIANKLLEMGVTVTPSNIDWYKRELIATAKGPPTVEVTFEDSHDNKSTKKPRKKRGRKPGKKSKKK